MSVLPTEVSINRVLCPWLFELSPSEKSKGDQHYFSFVGASFMTAHSQKQRPRGGVRIPPGGTVAAIFLFLLYFSFLKQRRTKWGLKDSFCTKAEGNRSSFVLLFQRIAWRLRLPSCRRPGCGFAFLRGARVSDLEKGTLLWCVTSSWQCPFTDEDE